MTRKEAQAVGTAAIKEKYRLIRESQFREGYLKSKTDKEFLIICALYWGEGTKHQCDFKITNSDIDLISVISKWITKEGYTFTCSLNFYDDNGLTEYNIKKKWEEKLGKVNWKKSQINKISRASQRKGLGKLLFGTIQLRVIKGSRLLNMIYGGIQYIKDTLGSSNGRAFVLHANDGSSILSPSIE